MIAVDVSAAVHHRAGLGRYAEGLLRALVAQSPDRYALFYNRERGVEPPQGLAHLPSHTVALGYKPWRMVVWLGQLSRIGFDRLLPGTSLFHATEHLLLPLSSIPTVLTVHDLIFRHLPAHHKPLNRWYLNLTMPLYCRRATHIITVSQATRRDLSAAYAIPEGKITVIYEAASPRFRPQSEDVIAKVRARYGLPDRYLLFVGTIEPRKNLTRLLSAFKTVHHEGLTEGLVVVGRRGWLYDDFFAALEESPAKEAVILPGYVPDPDLPAVYAGAQALVLPSLYEGFGLPVLEAMACGTPVACSGVSSLPEVAGDAALLFDPRDTDAIAAALHRILSRDDLREALADRGTARAGCFSWSRAATETQSVYDRIVDS
jgi:glycosyltransferase involved in cell wall biosynthesis